MRRFWRNDAVATLELEGKGREMGFVAGLREWSGLLRGYEIGERIQIIPSGVWWQSDLGKGL